MRQIGLCPDNRSDKKNGIIIMQIMKVQKLEELIEVVQKSESYNHEIKGKRLKKELKALSQAHFQNVYFRFFEVTSVAISMNVGVKAQGKGEVELVLRLDREYPFNPPQIFYIDDLYKSEYGYCKDLLTSILKNQIWGPSLTLPIFIQKLPNLATSLHRKQKLAWSYHPAFEYGMEELKKSGIKLYEVEEYKWEYKILKLKKPRILGFGPDCMLKFQRVLDAEDIVKLDFWTLLKDVTEVQAKTGKKNFQLQIDYTTNNKTQKLYLGGEPAHLQPILQSLNPIHTYERKIKTIQKSGITDYNEAIQCYSALIEHYSLTNKELTEKYMVAMKKLIESHYKELGNQQKMVEIKT